MEVIKVPSVSVSIDKQPRIKTVSVKVRLPRILVDFPLLGGIEEIVKKNGMLLKRRKMRWGDISSAVYPSLSPKAFKFFLVLLAQKQQKLCVSTTDIAPLIGSKKARRDFALYLEQLWNVTLVFSFLKTSVIPKSFGDDVGRKGDKLIFKTRLFDSSETKIIGKRKVAKINFAKKFYHMIEHEKKYVTVDLRILQQLSSSTPVEILTYLLCLRPQKINETDFLLRYFFGKSLEEFASEKDKINSLRWTVWNTYKKVLETLEKLVSLKVIADYKYSEKVIKIGSYSAPWFLDLEITKFKF